LACITVFIFGFFRPASLTQITQLHYLTVLSSGLALSLFCPLWLILRQHQNRKNA